MPENRRSGPGGASWSTSWSSECRRSYRSGSRSTALPRGVVFYASGWSLFLPVSEAFQVLAAVLVFVGLSLFTSGAYLTGKYVYSKLPEERPLLQRGPYRYIHHPIYLAVILTAVGFLLLAQNVVMLPLLIAFTAVRYPKVEEQERIRLYGDAYLEYRRRTGRFVPKFRRT